MISYDPILSNKYFNKSTQIYFFFLYYFQFFYRCLYIYDYLLWNASDTYLFFWESSESSYEQYNLQAQHNFTLMWKYYYLIYNYKTFFWWGNVYIYSHRNILYIWSTYWQLWPKQKTAKLYDKNLYSYKSKNFQNSENFVQLWLN